MGLAAPGAEELRQPARLQALQAWSRLAVSRPKYAFSFRALGEKQSQSLLQAIHRVRQQLVKARTALAGC